MKLILLQLISKVLKSPTGMYSKCKQHFTRIWNANHHCNNKHSCAL